MPKKNNLKKAIRHHEQKASAIRRANKAIESANKGRHKRKFRYALKDIRECNWVLRDTSSWWDYIASYFR